MSDFDPNKIHHKLVELGDDFADKNSAAKLLEDTTKSILASIALSVDAKSVAEADLKAKASKEYRDHVAAAVDARREADKAKVRYFAAQNWSDNMRTLAANRRAEMKLI